jgi:plastocyanin
MKGLVILVVVILLIVFGFSLFGGDDEEIGTEETGGGGSVIINDVVAEEDSEEDSSGEEVGDLSESNVIEMSSSGFSPKTLEVFLGETVVFNNVGDRNHWPASDVHPTHTVYPNSNIKKCGTSVELTLFDSCGGVPPSGSYSFTFNERGNWRYHDHLRANLKGTVIVR